MPDKPPPPAPAVPDISPRLVHVGRPRPSVESHGFENVGPRQEAVSLDDWDLYLRDTYRTR
jgi:hypothetical protein